MATETSAVNRSGYEREFNPVNIKVNDGKPFHTHCPPCGKLGIVTATLQRCSRCKSVAYCCRECQKADFKNHKISCRIIARTHEELQTESEKMTNSVDLFGNPISFFSSEYLGNFWSFRETRGYCDCRRKLFEFLVVEGKNRLASGGRINELALEIALGHAFDLMRAIRSDNQGLHFEVCALILTLGKYQQAYDFSKFWLTEHEDLVDSGEEEAFDPWDYDSDPDPMDEYNESPGPSRLALQMKDENFTEPIPQGCFSVDIYTPDQHLVDMALAKLYMFSEVRAAQILERCSDQNEDAVTMIASFTNVLSNWRHIDAGSLLTHARQLLTCLQRQNPRILPAIVTWIKVPGVRRDKYYTLYTEDVTLVMERTLHLWKNNKVAKNFVTNFMNSFPDSCLPALPIGRL